MTTLSLPPLPSIDYAVSSLSCTASPAEIRALTRAQWALHRGLDIVAVTGALLIPGSSGGVYRLAADGSCSCPASGPCYHQMIERIIIEARNARPTMPRLIKTRAEAAAEMSELFA